MTDLAENNALLERAARAAAAETRAEKARADAAEERAARWEEAATSLVHSADASRLRVALRLSVLEAERDAARTEVACWRATGIADEPTALASAHSTIATLRSQVEGLCALRFARGPTAHDVRAFFDAKAAWSLATFGPGERLAGVLAHVRKELDEITAKPSDLEEWIDVAMIAMDGAWRSAGADGAAWWDAMLAKHEKNLARQWPAIGTTSPDRPIEHVREHDALDAKLGAIVASVKPPTADELTRLAHEQAGKVRREQRAEFHEKWGRFVKCTCGKRLGDPASFTICREHPHMSERAISGYAPPPEAP